MKQHQVMGLTITAVLLCCYIPQCHSREEDTTTLAMVKTAIDELAEQLREIKSIIATNQNCSTREQLIEFQELLSKDECQDGSAKCSPVATCQDKLIGYNCQCPTGYSGDGLTCTGVDECDSKAHGCDSMATCINIDGRFICSCPSGYFGDGYNYCERISCTYPSEMIEGLGCVTSVNTRLNWESAKQNCLDRGSGSRLLDGFTSQQQLDVVKEKFRYSNPWVGLKGKPWISVESGDALDLSSPLWDEGKPNYDGDEACGYLCLGCSRPSLRDNPCSNTRSFLCQRK